MLADLAPNVRRTSFVQLESSAFVGRRRELVELGRAMREGRLATLVGEAGVGKTRLAQRFALAERAAHERAGGVWFCDLSDARDVESMSAAVLRTLSIAGEASIGGGASGAGDAAVTAVGRALGARGPLLLVLDNVQQLLPEGAAVVLRWLDLAPDARMVVTSRAPLYLLGEELIEVGPLPVPLPDGDVAGDAFALFVARVRGLRAGYTPSGAESRVIGELMRRVRGVPLAIELCASRVSAGDDIGRVPRAPAEPIAWSFHQLDPIERDALAQCSVFRGGFTMEAAARVVVLSGGRPAGAVLSVLLRKGLLQCAPRAPRLSMCEGMRAHAALVLEHDAEASGAPWRHAQHYLALASGPLTDLPGAGAAACSREELAAERENLEAVLELGAAHCPARADVVLRAAIALDVLSSGTGLSRSHLALLDAALAAPVTQLAQPAQSLDPVMVGRALGVRAAALRAVGRLAEAERDAATALGLAEQSGSARQIVAMRLAVSDARFQMGDLEAALAHARAALDEARRSDHGDEPVALQQVGSVLQAAGDLAGARAHHESALALAVEAGLEAAEARAAMGLGSCHLEAGDFERAEACYDRGLLIARRLGMQRSVRIVMGYLGVLHLDAGRAQEADRWLENAAGLSREVGDLRVEGVFTGMRGAALAMLDLVDEARAAFALAAELLRENAYFAAVIAVHRGHLDLAEARAALAEGDEGCAAELCATAERRLRMTEAGAGGEPPLVRRSDDARIAARILRRALAGMC